MEASRVVLLLMLLCGTLFPSGLCQQAVDDELHSLLSPSLHHYSTLHPHTITHTLHGSPSHPHHSRMVAFHTLERKFQLYLRPHVRLFSPGFKVESVDESGHHQTHEINRNEYYHGYVGGDEKSVVTAHISRSGVLTGSVLTASEVYYFEPSDHFIKKPHPPRTIAYRASDVKNRVDGLKFDYVVTPPLPPGEQTETNSDHYTNSQHQATKSAPQSNNDANYRNIPPEDHQTVKRQSQGNIGGDSCPMALIADFRFVGEFGGGQATTDIVAGITRRLVSLVSDVDSTIYRNTVWILDPIDDRTTTGLGLEIASVIIHTSPLHTTFSQDPHQYYNSDQCCGDVVSGSLDADSLLTALNYGNWGDYCLAHLFTYKNFNSGLLGLANIASSFRSQTGGICSDAFTDSTQQRAIIYNTGLSSFTSGGTPLIRQEQILVVGHELGHNWGSHHDPGKCKNGYLMNEFAQDGAKSTHSMFSICSRTSIGQVLAAKARCFMDRGACGDYVLNKEVQGGQPEECDEGPMGGACCTDECKLKPGTNCSDTNYPCCVNCQVASASRVCDVAGTLTTNCSVDVFCNGVNLTCPNVTTSGQAPSGTECLRGLCRGTSANSSVTECVDICVFENKTTCKCSGEDECKICCVEEDGSCQPSAVSQPTGIECSTGNCLGGRCRQVQDTITFIFDIIANLDVDAFVMFMEENIVGFTIVLTLLLWIPATLLIHFCYDHRVWKMFKKDNPDYIRSLTEKLPLVQEYGELGSRSTSPIDDSPHPTYSRATGLTGLSSIPEEREDSTDDVTRTMIN